MGVAEPPMLVFFTRATSGPARRMESLLAHVARKERDRLRVRRVDADDHPSLLRKFAVDQVPALVLVIDHKVVGRIDGRANMPQIEEMLEQNLTDAVAVEIRCSNFSVNTSFTEPQGEEAG